MRDNVEQLYAKKNENFTEFELDGPLKQDCNFFQYVENDFLICTYVFHLYLMLSMYLQVHMYDRAT